MVKMKKLKFTILFLVTILAVTVSFFAQTKKRDSAKKMPQPAATVQPEQEKTQTDAVDAPKNQGKKNERPTAGNEQTNAETSKITAGSPVYFYEFSQPNFLISKIFIEHDEDGKGKITFLKQGFGEPVSDPITLSAEGIEKVKMRWQTLDFLSSTENYQYEKDYSHLGNMKFTMKKDKRERTAEFNWTDNKDAKALADEYRRIGNRYIWLFDFSVARENQPLETPRLMDSLDSMIKRDDFFDVKQMAPYLKGLADDERIPLIARNHAARLARQIEDQTAKKQDDKK